MSEKKDVKNIKTDNPGLRWGWFLTLGIILLIFGFIACLNISLATVVSVVFIGIFMLFGGAAQIIHAFNVTRWKQFFLWLLSGIVYTLAGAACFFNPYLTGPVLIFALAFALIIAGIIRMIIGFRDHYVTGSYWVIIAGIITTLLGIAILIGWPASWWILGLLLAIDLIFQGWGWIAFALGLRSAERKAN